MTCVMIIDDDELLVRSMKLLLESEDYDVISAFSGVEGINKLKNTKPDLILLDIMMPGMDGWETLRRIRDDESLTLLPVIIMTAKHSTTELQWNKERLDFTDYLKKPFECEDLYSLITKTLRC